MQKIFISTTSFGKYDPRPLALIEEQGVEYELNPLGRTLTEEEIIKFLKEKDGLIAGTEPLTKKVLDQSNRLKVISRLGVGLDNVDLNAAEQRNIRVFNTPDGPTQAVAELTLGLILSLLRSIPGFNEKMKMGIWKKNFGALLHNKTVGIIGFGRIGRRVAELLGAFQCKLVIYDPFTSDICKTGEKVDALDDLLKIADVITLHLAYSKENHHLINKQRLGLMKGSAILINTSRGGLIDEKALFDSLKHHQLAGAALDTFGEEPYKGQLKQLDNIILTPHIGSYAKEARAKMEIDSALNLLKGLDLKC